ncbi:DUF6456 domain-containing protein [Rhodoligotrophos defluvii]|uniref:DUF6456 domain-containing protein n=1 Tax=Rhodoligotrophos defluvii TaxID=2561934 RepID=UPI001EF0315E|nr:DUF6456 domain-containing protein [Rhodoligotrophos defluvii]
MGASEIKITRDAERCFPKLAIGHRLVWRHEGQSGQWHLTGGDGAERSGTVDDDIVKAWLTRDWVARRERDVMELTTAGRAWLKRRRTGGPNPYRAQHQCLYEQKVRHGARWERVTVNAGENPLSWLARRKDANGNPLITAEQLAAGERLHRDYTLAAMIPRVTTQWDPSRIAHAGQGGAKGSADLQDSVIAARARLNAALEATGPELGKVLLQICCLANGLEAAERMFGWPPRSAKVVLQIALTQLARHYGLIGAVSGPPRARAVRSWRLEGLRPGL